LTEPVLATLETLAWPGKQDSTSSGEKPVQRVRIDAREKMRSMWSD